MRNTTLSNKKKRIKIVSKLKKNRSFDEVRIGLKNNSLTCESITTEYIEEIRKSNLNAFVEVFEEEALKKAKEVDIKLNQGNAGK